MRKIYVLVVIMLAFYAAQAQTAAQNWTKNDCAGRSHDLFTELDSGNVVILEYVMMNCGSCITAGNGLKNITAPYAATHPGRVRMYSIGYTNSYTCTQMDSWKTANNFTHPVFTDGAADVAYYGGMGMPTIVIVGNNTHTVYYKKLGYSASDNAAITAALNQALAVSNPAGIASQNALNLKATIYPNPAIDQVNLVFENSKVEQIKVTDLTGKVLITTNVTKTESSARLQTTGLANGVYLVHFVLDGKVISTSRFIKTDKE